MSLQLEPRPFLKWVGGKRSLLKEIHARLPQSFNNYFEPFLGGGAVFFSLSNKIKQATLADNNLELVLTYRVIQKEPHALIARLKEHAKEHSKTYYYAVRKIEPSTPLETAARFLYLNKTCFNGLFRVNKSGKFNSPMGKYEKPNIVQEENIMVCHEVLQKAWIKFGDFSEINPEKGDFVYFDPPYHPTTELSFTDYTKDSFSESDQVRLRDFVIELHKRGVYVMLSNSKTSFVESIYNKKYFTQHTVMAPRFVNCKPSERNKVEELLITNY